LDPTLVTAITGGAVAVITAILTIPPAISAYRTAKLAAKRDEVQLLRDEVMRLQGRVEQLSRANERLEHENTLLHIKIVYLESENQWLRDQLRMNGIAIPRLPDALRAADLQTRDETTAAEGAS